MKLHMFTGIAVGVKSPPSRGAWIEITLADILEQRDTVAPLAGGVD